MLEKTMKQIITTKVRAWLDTINENEVRAAIQKDLIITGGCFTSMIQNEVPKDFDCYFRTKETVLKVAQYYADVWNEQHSPKENGAGFKCKVMVLDGANPSDDILNYFGEKKVKSGTTGAVIVDNCPPERVKMVFPSDGYTGDPEEVQAAEELGTGTVEVVEELDEIKADEILEKEKKEFNPVFISSNAITLSKGIQIVVRFYGEPTDIHNTYDFEHTKAYYDFGKNLLEIPRKVYECVVNKTLIYTGSKYPVCSIFRLRKFINRGWKVNAGQMLKICLQISELNLMDINVLEDQLIGVDSLYFINLIQQFREQKEKDDTFELTSNYVISIIDKIF